MRKFTQSLLLTAALLANWALTQKSVSAVVTETPNPTSVFERTIHQQLDDGENAVNIFVNNTDAFLRVTFNVFAFSANPTTGASALSDSQTLNPYAVGQAITLAPAALNLGSDYQGYVPFAPRVNLVSICAHPDHLYGHCLEVNAFYDTAILTNGDEMTLLVPPGGQVWANPFRDYFDGDYSNNSGVVAYKVKEFSVLYLEN